MNGVMYTYMYFLKLYVMIKVSMKIMIVHRKYYQVMLDPIHIYVYIYVYLYMYVYIYITSGYVSSG
jgi:hypothetical protein